MMYPRGDYKPSPCPDCKGTGKHRAWQGEGKIICDSCNGTGIDGNPRLGMILIFLTVSIFWSMVVIWLS